jgi:hypothetical protein
VDNGQNPTKQSDQEPTSNSRHSFSKSYPLLGGVVVETNRVGGVLAEVESSCRLSKCRGKIEYSDIIETSQNLAEERDAALMDFQHSDLTDNPHKLAKLAGEIAALDRVLRVLQDD